MPIDAAHLALLQNLTANSGAIAKLLQHPHQQNVAEHQKELQQQQQQHQQQQQQQQQQSQHHIGRPEPISLQQQMEKNRAQQEASARQNPASLLRPGMVISRSVHIARVMLIEETCEAIVRRICRCSQFMYVLFEVTAFSLSICPFEKFSRAGLQALKWVKYQLEMVTAEAPISRLAAAWLGSATCF